MKAIPGTIVLVKNRAITATQPLYTALSDTHQCNYHSLALTSSHQTLMIQSKRKEFPFCPNDARGWLATN